MPIKTKGNTHAKADSSKAKRRGESDARNTEWRKKSLIDQRAELMNNRPGDSIRQITRIDAKLEKLSKK